MGWGVIFFVFLFCCFNNQTEIIVTFLPLFISQSNSNYSYLFFRCFNSQIESIVTSSNYANEMKRGSHCCTLHYAN